MNTQRSDAENSQASLIDVKEVTKRVYQLVGISMCSTLMVASYFYAIGLMGSSYIDFCFGGTLGMLILLHYFRVIRNLQLYIIVAVNLMLFTTAFVEGPGTGQYMYFFPVLVAIPCILNFDKVNLKEIITYVALTVVFFVLSITIQHLYPSVEVISEAMRMQMFLSNTCFAFVLTILFSFMYIYFELHYIKQLKAEKHKAVTSRTRFLSTMGHELRTPLNGIIGAVNILKDDGLIDQDNQYFQILKYCSDHMLQQVNDILDFNKIEAGKLEIHPVRVNLMPLLKNVILPFYHSFKQKDVHLEVNIDPELDTEVWADDIRLIQILNNLLSNALKFTQQGFVKLKVYMAGQTSSGIQVRFMVQDTGMGIAGEDQQKIFGGFWQVYDQSTRYINGTGLGLNICVRLLEMMESKLHLESEKGKGSRFSFEVNFKHYERDLTEMTLPVLTGNEDLEGIHILVVEDNAINMMIAKKTLHNYKATYTAATNGQEALNLLKQNADYDIILLDLEMPVLNGYETIVHINHLYPHIPVLAFTASMIDQQMLSSLVAAGFEDVIQKPFQPHQLIAQIRPLLQASE